MRLGGFLIIIRSYMKIPEQARRGEKHQIKGEGGLAGLV